MGKTGMKEQETLKIVIQDHKISVMVSNLHKRWRNMEQDSRRPDRSSKPTFQDNLRNLKEE